MPLTPFDWTNSTLPANVSTTNSQTEKINYNIALTIDESLETFNGSMSLTFTVTNAMTGLVLHSKGLSITSATLVVSPTSSMDAKRIAYNEKYEYALLTFSKSVPKGLLTLNLAWSGVISSGTEGLYRSSYVDEANPQGPKKVMLATQFEPNYARRVFPCFDEPAYRAYFTITVNAPVSSFPRALSNMPLSPDPPVVEGTTTSFVFSQNPNAIPPYLVAFALGDLSYVEGTFGAINPRPLRVYFPRPSQRDLARFALSSATKFMNYFESTTQLPYPFPKLDMLAIPDFGAGAMENPGLITYRETALLVDHDTTPSFASRMRVAEVVAHEIAHQWYGNTLAPATWGDLWVAEGSATYWSYQALEAIYPEFAYTKNFFINDEWISAMDADELASTSAVHRDDVPTPSAARGLFDVTTYSKGASIIRHINAQLGAGELISTMANWFRLNPAGASISSNQYLQIMSPTSRPSVGPNAASYIHDPSNPVLNFSFPINSTSPGRLFATMQSYAALYNNQYSEDFTANWSLPVQIVSGVGNAPSSAPSNSLSISSNFGTLSSTTRNLTVPLSLSQNDWYKANPDGLYYYRTQYPVSNWEKLITAVANGDNRLNAQDKAILLSDAFSWAEIGQLPYSIPLRLSIAALVPTEKNYAVWRAALDELAVLNDVVQDLNCAGNFHLMLSSILTPAYEYWTWNISEVNSNQDSWHNTPITKRGFAQGTEVASVAPIPVPAPVEPVPVPVEPVPVPVEPVTVPVEPSPVPVAVPTPVYDPKAPVYTSVTPNASDVSLRTLILSVGADYIQSESFGVLATNAVNAYLNDPVANALPSDTAAAMLKVAVTRGNFRLWERVWARYLASNDAYERTRLLAALSWTDLDYKARALLASLIDPSSPIRSQDFGLVLGTIAKNHHTGADIIWRFFQQNYEIIINQFPQTLGSWVSPLSTFSDTYRIQEINNFFSLSHPELEVDTASITEVIADNALWVQQYTADLCSVVSAAYPGSKRASVA